MTSLRTVLLRYRSQGGHDQWDEAKFWPLSIAVGYKFPSGLGLKFWSSKLKSLPTTTKVAVRTISRIVAIGTIPRIVARVIITRPVVSIRVRGTTVEVTRTIVPISVIACTVVTVVVIEPAQYQRCRNACPNTPSPPTVRLRALCRAHCDHEGECGGCGECCRFCHRTLRKQFPVNRLVCMV